MRRTPLKRKPRKKRSDAEKQAHDRFREEVLARGECHRFWTGQCDTAFGDGFKAAQRSLDPHHIIRKTKLKAHTSTLPDAERWQIVHDPRIGIPLCHRHHSMVTNWVWPITRSEVPAAAEDFAAEQGLEWLLSKECPEDEEFFFG